jgi:hypothetical protein
VQQEIVAAALEDPEVFAILAQRQDVVGVRCWVTAVCLHAAIAVVDP